jgi:hypothetical protein
MPMYREHSSDDVKPWPLTRNRVWIKRLALAIAIISFIVLYNQ